MGLLREARLDTATARSGYISAVTLLYLGGASTHPGGGVHDGPGANAARVLLGDLGMATRFAAAFS
jgi:phytoene dehydrogenase-like protein